MVNIKWCCKQKEGIKLIDPNENLANAYIEMALDSLRVMNHEKEESLRWTISSCYYSMYYCLYAIFMKMGIKSEIHSCTLEFMKVYLLDFYSKEDYELIKKAFDCRNSIQYYVDRIIDKKDSTFIISKAPSFLDKSKEILSKLNQENIENIRKSVKLIMQEIIKKVS